MKILALVGLTAALQLGGGRTINARSTIDRATPKICDSVEQASGIIRNFAGRRFFYWHFQSHRAPARDPLLVYVNGALGSSSLLGRNSGMFPCRIDRHGNRTHANPFAWNSHANLLFVDPIGIGFSSPAAEEARLLPADIAYVLQQFMRAYPALRSTNVHLVGESYGSALLLEAAKVILRMGHPSLGSVIVGSALVDAAVHYALLPDLARKVDVSLDSAACIDAINDCRAAESDCIAASATCQQALVHPYQDAGFSIHHLDKTAYLAEADVVQRTEAFLNANATKAELGVPLDYTYTSRKTVTNEAVLAETLLDRRSTIAELSEGGVRILLYAGDLDYLANSLGLSALLLSPRTSQLESALTGAPIGSLLRTPNITAVKFADASHYVSASQEATNCAGSDGSARPRARSHHPLALPPAVTRLKLIPNIPLPQMS